jgi:hypothetical protein
MFARLGTWSEEHGLMTLLLLELGLLALLGRRSRGGRSEGGE